MDARGPAGNYCIAARLRTLPDYLPGLQAGTYLLASRLADALSPAAGPREFVCAAICAAGEFPDLYRRPVSSWPELPDGLRTLLPRVATAAGGSDFGTRVREEIARMEREGQGCACEMAAPPYAWRRSPAYVDHVATARDGALPAPRDRRLLPRGAAEALERLAERR